MREAESIINEPLLPCHSRRLGITIGAAFANKTAGVTNRKGKRTVKIIPMPSNIIVLNMTVLFFKNCAPSVYPPEVLSDLGIVNFLVLDNVAGVTFSHK
jgi:hypothetical protein